MKTTDEWGQNVASGWERRHGRWERGRGDENVGVRGVNPLDGYTTIHIDVHPPAQHTPMSILVYWLCPLDRDYASTSSPWHPIS